MLCCDMLGSGITDTLQKPGLDDPPWMRSGGMSALGTTTHIQDMQQISGKSQRGLSKLGQNQQWPRLIMPKKGHPRSIVDSHVCLIFHHGGEPKNSPLALKGRFPSLMGRFLTLMGHFPKCLTGPLSLLKFPGEKAIKKRPANIEELGP